MRRFREHLSYANVTATLALVMAVSGTAVAVGGLPGKNSVRTSDIKNRHVRTKDIQNGGVKLADTAASLRLKCPGGTQFLEGACIESTNRAAANFGSAEGTCVNAGRRLPAVTELVSARSEPGITLDSPNGEWSLNWSFDGTTNRSLAVNETGFSLITTAASSRKFRCVARPIG